MKEKFNEVTFDILKLIDKLDYEDMEKNIIKANIMMNISMICESEEKYDKNIYTLKKEQKHNQHIQFNN